jgi:heme ABC exporter ATP-binding subunit CcmA
VNEQLPAVYLERLARRYGREMVLVDINLSIAPGRIVVLHGPNGAGKTTLLKVMATRLRPSQGSGRIFGFDLVREAHQVRQRIAMLNVFGGAYPALTAHENLRLAASLYGRELPAGELTTRLAEVGLADARGKAVRSFSSGMKKRLGLARLKLAEAKLWLLDEPYAALDESGKSSVDELLEGARRDGITVVLASHELERVRPYAHAVLQVENRGILKLNDASRQDQDQEAEQHGTGQHGAERV